MTELSANIGGGRHLGHTTRDEQPESAWRFAIAGLCASLVGLGLARFAYTPLIPALISAKWFSASDVVYLGAANLAGYLAGALLARPAAARIGAVAALRTMMLLATLSCLASSVPVSFLWFFVWRFLAGLTGGIIMVLAATVILPHTSPARRGIVGGVIFAGVGLGVAASGTLVPLLLQQGLQQAWIGLGVLSGVLTLISWTNWPKQAPAPYAAASPSHPKRHRQSPAVRALLIQYGLNAAALVPHMVFVVDFVARGLGQGIAAGSHYWVLYGLGAIVGPLLTGHLGDRTGFGPALRAAFLVEAVAVLLPAVSTAPVSLIVSSVIVGGFTPGIVPLVLGRIHELVPHSAEQQRATWGHATTSFALFQAAAAYGFSFLFARTGGDYLLLFQLGGGAAALALAIDLVMALTVKRNDRKP
ncbi:YbfB/YjiJ family MFS transporter [Afipia sp. GAS231]|uniref:YbfB/YjiJ family MFS transporter n=1 Tax=Afipia sp. GAS231 TaxID=1882747 RepID=UPI00087A3D54|nr:YbfB/YjiJ family MFS transporter [Afipia sp. GAS231]SDN34588.1 Predicted arabinose efflux permease, MFS family [Afipia sp. GAS231]